MSNRTRNANTTDRLPDVTDLSTKQSAIRAEGVSKTFGTEDRPIVALSSVDLTIKDGEFIAIVGPSGCGKSTLLRIVAGISKPTTGTVTTPHGVVTSPLTDVGIVFQSPVLLDWRNILDNVLIQFELRGIKAKDFSDRARNLLGAVGLGDFLNRYPRELSGGMRQRAAIARALVHNPSLLLMDEPFGALDALTREQMRVDLEALWLKSRKTVLFVTHGIDEAVLLADRVVVMSPRPGRIEQVIEVDIPRPRGLGARRDPTFLRITEEITNIFLSRGVFHQGSGLSESLGH
ncbi:ABC transporter ATP-binding protein [Pseudolabrys sp. Root1462]|uniref:ABC transporter ATP-binding protein n=1 Tax=Pseudolabrys sp. Root1462 TaxID=1736466 RepID=UPI0009E8E389|nr:ABC transporter ATP-binding protein [Pseudolabrys sp. Root1462]